jgi:hypothetical protein
MRINEFVGQTAGPQIDAGCGGEHPRCAARKRRAEVTIRSRQRYSLTGYDLELRRLLQIRTRCRGAFPAGGLLVSQGAL